MERRRWIYNENGRRVKRWTVGVHLAGSWVEVGVYAMGQQGAVDCVLRDYPRSSVTSVVNMENDGPSTWRMSKETA